MVKKNDLGARDYQDTLKISSGDLQELLKRCELGLGLPASLVSQGLQLFARNFDILSLNITNFNRIQQFVESAQTHLAARFAAAQVAAQLYQLNLKCDVRPTIQEVSQNKEMAAKVAEFVQKFANVHMTEPPTPLGPVGKTKAALKLVCVVLRVILSEYDSEQAGCGIF